MAHELGVREVDADVDVAEEAHAACERLPVEGVLQALDLLVVGGNAAAQQAPRGGQPLEEVDLHRAGRAPQARCGEGPGRPRPDDGHARLGHQAAVRSAVLRSAKNSALRSSA